jgi:hypothetical protein
MIEDLIDFIEIQPIVAFEAIYEPMLTSFWSLISFTVQLYIIMQYKGKHPPLLTKMPFCLLYLPPKLMCIHQNFLHRVYTNLNSSFLDPSFLEWGLGCKTCIVYTGLDILSTRSGLDLQLISQSSTGKTYERGTRKAIFRSVTLYNKHLYSQYNLSSNRTSVG